jgi:hypothetical protein
VNILKLKPDHNARHVCPNGLAGDPAILSA